MGDSNDATEAISHALRQEFDGATVSIRLKSDASLYFEVTNWATDKCLRVSDSRIAELDISGLDVPAALHNDGVMIALSRLASGERAFWVAAGAVIIERDA